MRWPWKRKEQIPSLKGASEQMGLQIEALNEWSIVGENGPEAFWSGPAGFVMPTSASISDRIEGLKAYWGDEWPAIRQLMEDDDDGFEWVQAGRP